MLTFLPHLSFYTLTRHNRFSGAVFMSDSEFSAIEPVPHQDILQGKSILIVDDDPIFRRITGAFLESLGCVIAEAAHGLDCLMRLKEEKYDLVMCDLSMPILNGIELVEELSLSYPSLPMIVISATEAMSDVAKALKYGIKDFIAKPVRDYSGLASTIANVLHDSTNHISEQRDFASQWYRIDDGQVAEEKELHWHLDYLQNNPAAARDVLQALMPEKDTRQGEWRFSYRLLQSVEVMPMVFDYAWIMDGQFIFYLVDSGSHATDGVGSSLLMRAIFHDYIRNLKSSYADLKDLADLVEKGIDCGNCSGSVAALFGVVDTVSATLSVLPAGIDSRWRSGAHSVAIKGGRLLGEKCTLNFMTKGIGLAALSQLLVNTLGVCSFTLDIVKTKHQW